MISAFVLLMEVVRKEPFFTDDIDGWMYGFTGAFDVVEASHILMG